MQKLKALNLLEATISRGNNYEMVCYAEKKILNRLLTLARFKKVSFNPPLTLFLLGIKRPETRCTIVRQELQSEPLRTLSKVPSRLYSWLGRTISDLRMHFKIESPGQR